MPAPTLHFYSTETFEYMGTKPARMVPRRDHLPDDDPRKWLRPPNATETAPPDRIEGFARVFDPQENRWTQEPDFRGKMLWLKARPSREPQENFFTGIGPLPDEFTDQDPSAFDYPSWDQIAGQWFEDLEKKDETERAAVNAERSRRLQVGCAVTVSGLGAAPLVQGRTEDKANLLGLHNAAQYRLSQGDTVGPMEFRDGLNDLYQLTPAQMLELYFSSALYVEAVYKASWTIKAMDPRPEDVTDDALWPDPVWPQQP